MSAGHEPVDGFPLEVRHKPTGRPDGWFAACSCGWMSDSAQAKVVNTHRPDESTTAVASWKALTSAGLPSVASGSVLTETSVMPWIGLAERLMYLKFVSLRLIRNGFARLLSLMNFPTW